MCINFQKIKTEKDRQRIAKWSRVYFTFWKFTAGLVIFKPGHHHIDLDFSLVMDSSGIRAEQ